ncbi:MAG: hypothetical protein ABS35_22215 [Kaistia sp. SCN 65-12]|nr:MAG: hypothetical protein ABS35_22215 [Kaistia sp. SCN 65-12]
MASEPAPLQPSLRETVAQRIEGLMQLTVHGQSASPRRRPGPINTDQESMTNLPATDRRVWIPASAGMTAKAISLKER